MDDEELSVAATSFQRSIPKLRQAAMIPVCSLIIQHSGYQTLLDDLLDHLKEECLMLLQRMRFNLLHLQKNQHQFNSDAMKNPRGVAWTPFGTVDMAETFRINKQLIPPKDRFKLACYLCLEDEILSIWREESVEGVSSETWKIKDVYVDEKILFYWTKSCRSAPIAPGEIFDIFQVCVRAHYFYPLAHFWTKLTQRERETGIQLFIRSELDYLDLLVDETIDIAAFLLNNMSESQKNQLLKAQPGPLLTCFSHFYPLRHFINIFQYFLVNTYINLPNAFSICMRFYECLCKDFHALYHNSFDCPFRRYALCRESLILVLQDASCSREDLVATFGLLVDYYEEMLIWKLRNNTELARTVVKSNVVARIVKDFGEHNGLLEAAYKQALENKTSKAVMVFMFQFTITFRRFLEHA